MSKAAELAALIGSQTALSNRNLIINGAMQVAQRGTSATGIGGTGDTYKVLDRFRYGLNGGDATAGRFTASQAAITDLPGFGFAHKLDCTTADTSIAAGEAFTIQQRIEGQNLQQLAKGTSSAKAVTVSFYAKGTAKKYMLEIQDAENSRIIQQQFDVTTSWQRFSITFPGDTSGTVANDNAVGLYLNMWLHGGSTYSSGTYNASTWKAQSNADRAAGIDSFFSSTDNELFITGVQMELGEQATPFEHRSFADELARCQRYYERYSGWTEAEATLLLSGRILSSNRNDACYFFRTKKRAAPSLTMISDNGSGGTSPSIVVFPSNATSETLSFISAAISGANTCSAIIRTTGGATLTNGHNSTTMMATDFAFDAEL